MFRSSKHKFKTTQNLILRMKSSALPVVSIMLVKMIGVLLQVLMNMVVL